MSLLFDYLLVYLSRSGVVYEQSTCTFYYLVVLDYELCCLCHQCDDETSQDKAIAETTPNGHLSERHENHEVLCSSIIKMY